MLVRVVTEGDRAGVEHVRAVRVPERVRLGGAKALLQGLLGFMVEVLIIFRDTILYISFLYTFERSGIRFAKVGPVQSILAPLLTV